MNTGRFCYFTFFIIFHFIVGCNINTEIESAKGSKALPQYSVSDASVNEGSSANFNFDLETPATKDYIIKWEVQFVDSNSDDLVSLGGSVEIKKGDTGFVISIPTQDDNSFEADEEFNLIITEVNGKSTNELVAKGTIANDDPPPEVSFQLASQTVNESAGAVSALVRLNEISGLDVFIPYTLSGTADVNDHNQADGFFVILAGDIATGFIVTITDDTESEASEELIITMSTPTGGTATLGAQKVHTITISDNDTQVIITAPLETDTITSGNENSLSVSGTCSEAGQEVTISADDTNGGTSAVTPVVQPTCSGGNTFSTTINVSSLDDDTITITASHSNVGATSTGNDSVALTKNTVIPNPFLWTGGAHPDANWSTGANWQGGVAPSNTDIATFDGSCTNCNVTMDTNIDVAGINMQSGYTGTITQNAGVTVDVGASGWVQQAGIFQGSGGNINLNGTSTLAGGIFNSTSGILSINKQIDFTGITFNHNNGVVDLNATAPDEITGGGQTFNHLRIVATGGGGMSPFNGIFNVAGDMTINTNRHIESSAIFNIQKDLIINNIGYNLSITLRLVGSTSQNVISGMGEMRIPPIELASTGGIITFLDDQDFRGSVIYTSGTLDFGTTSTKLRASSTDTVHLPGIELYNLELTAFSGGIGAFTSDIIVKNNFVHSSAHQLDNNITFYVEGDVSIPGGTLVAQDSLYNVEFKGAGDQHFSFTGTKLTFGNFIVNKPSGSLILDTSLNMSAAGQDLTVQNGVLNLNGFDLTVSDQLNVGDGVGAASSARILNGSCGVITAGTQNVNPTDGEIVGSSSNPDITISDATVTEGGNLVFNVTLSEGVCGGDFTVNYTVNDGTATTANSDYATPATDSDATSNDGILTLTGGATSGTITVSTTSDSTMELDETLTVFLSSNSHGTLIDNSGVGVIENDDDNGFIWTGDAGDNDFSNGANWSNGSTAPGSSDIAMFDDTCNDVPANCDAETSTNVDVLGLLINSNYVGTITQNSSHSITVRATGWRQEAGTFAGGDSLVDLELIDQSGGTYTATSGDMKVGNSTLNTGNGFTISGGTFNHNNGTLIFDSRYGSSSSAPGANEIMTVDVNSSLTLNNVKIDIDDDYSIGGYNATRLQIASGDTLVVNSLTLIDGVIKGGTIDLKGNLIVECLDGFSGRKCFSGGDTVINFSGTSTQTYQFVNNDGSAPILQVNNPTNINPESGTTYANFSKLTIIQGIFTAPSNDLILSYGTDNEDQTDGLIITGGSFIHNNGTLNLQFSAYSAASSTGSITAAVIDVPSSISLNNLTIDSNDNYLQGGYNALGIVIAAGDTIIVNGDFNFEDGYLAGGTIDLKGNLNINCSDGPGNNKCPDGATTNLLFSGSTDQNIQVTTGAGVFQNQITINKMNGDVILLSNVNLNVAGSDLNILNGDLDLNGFDLTVNDQLNVGDGVGAASSARVIKGCSTITAGAQNVNPTDGEIVGSSSSPNVTISDATVTEGGNLVFNVTLSEGVCGGDFTVNYTVNDGTATTADSDYNATATDSDATPNDGVLTLTGGATTGTITVATTADATMELDETLTVVLDTPSHGTLTDDSGVGVIENDDDNGFIWTGDAGDNDFSNGANWSNGSTAPGASDIVMFDDTCNDVPANCDVNINSNVSVDDFLIESNYTGTIAQNSGFTITVTDDFTQRAGTFIGGDSNITVGDFDLSGGLFTSTSAVFQIGKYHGSQSNPYNYGFIFTSGGFIHNNGKVLFKPSYNNGAAKIQMIVNVPSGVNFYDLEVDAIRNTCCSATIEILIGQTITVLNDYSQLDGVVNTGSIAVKGNLNFAYTDSIHRSEGGSATILINGNAAQEYTFDSDTLAPKMEINTTGSLSPASGTTTFNARTFKIINGTFNAPSGIMRVGEQDIGTPAVGAITDGFDILGGTFNHNNGTLKLNPIYYSGATNPIMTVNAPSGLTINNLIIAVDKINAGSNAVNIFTGDILDVLGDLTIEDGSLNTGAVNVNGDLSFTYSTSDIYSRGGSTKINIVGSGNQNINVDAGATVNSNNFEINKSGGSLSLFSDINLSTVGQDLTILNGDLDLNGFDLTVNDQLNVGDGVGAANSARLIQGCSTVTAGTTNVNPTDGEIVGSSSNPNVTISDATVTEGGNLIFNVTLSEGVCGGDFTVNYTVNDGTATTADSDYSTPAADSDATPNDGILTLIGGATTGTITIATTTDATMELDETLTVVLDTPSHGTLIDDTGVGVIENDDDNGFIWTGNAGDGNFSNGANWSNGSTAPGASDIVKFDDTCSDVPANCDSYTTANVTIARLMMNSNYPGAFTQNSGHSITISSGHWVQDGGVFVGGDAFIDIARLYLYGGSFTSTSGQLRVGENNNNNGGFRVYPGATFIHNAGEVRMDGQQTAGVPTHVGLIYAPGGVDLNNLVIDARDNDTGSSGADAYVGMNSDTTLTIHGDLTIRDGYIAGVSTSSSGNIFLKGNLILEDVSANIRAEEVRLNYSKRLPTVYFDGDTPQVYTGNQNTSGPHIVVNTTSTVSTASSDIKFASLSIQNGTFTAPSGELKLGYNTSDDVNINSGFSHTGGTFIHNSGKVTFASSGYFNNPKNGALITSTSGTTFYDFQVSLRDTYSGSGYDDLELDWTGTPTLTIENDLTVTDGIVMAGGSFVVHGNVHLTYTNSERKAEGFFANLNFGGASDSTTQVESGATGFSSNLRVSKNVGNSLTLLSDLILSSAGLDLRIDSGTLDLNGFDLTVNDQLNVGDGVGAASSARVIKGCSTITAGAQNVNPTDGEIVGSSSSPNVTISDATITEGGNLVFNVTLSEGVCGGDFTVNYTVNDGTATTADSDYNATATDSDATPNDGVLTLTGGATTGTITVATTADATMELDETLTVVLDTPSHGTLTDDSGVGVIENDDDNGFIWTGDAGDNDFSNGANWSNGSTAPGPSDIAMFDDTCNDVPANCDVNTSVNVDVLGLWLAENFPGTLTQSSGDSLTIGASNWIQRGGVFVGGDSSITVTGDFTMSAGTFSSTTGTFSMNHTSSTSCSSGQNYFTFSGGSFIHNNGTMRFAGSMGAGTAFSQNAYSKIITVNASGGLILNNLITDAKDSGCSTNQDVANVEFTNGQTITVLGDYTHREGGIMQGTIDLSGDLIIECANSSNDCARGGRTVINMVSGGTQTYTQAPSGRTGQLRVSNNTTVLPAAGTTNLDIDKFRMDSGSFTAPSGTLTLRALNGNGCGSLLSYSDGFVINSGTFVHNNGLVYPLFSAPSGSSVTAFTFDVPSSVEFYNLTIYGSDYFCGGTDFHDVNISLSNDTIKVLNNFTFYDGTIDTGTLEVYGDVTFGCPNSGAYHCADGGTAKLTLAGAGNQTITASSVNSNEMDGEVTVNKPSGEVIQASDIDFNGSGQDLTILNGDLDLNGFDLTVNDQLNVGDGVGSASSARIIKGCSTITAGTQNVNPTDGEIVNSSENPNITITDESELEGSDLVFTVSLSEGICSGDFTVNYTVNNGTATTANSDYNATPDDSDATPIDGTLTLSGGATSGTITVHTTTDSTLETDEYLTLSLNTASHGSITDDTGVGVLRNDDGQENTTILSSTGTNNNSEWDGTHIGVDSTYDGNGLTDGTWMDTTGLVGYWKFNEDPAQHNTTITDTQSTSNGTFVTNDGSTNKSVIGQLEKSINLDGTDDYISLTDNAIFDPGGAMTSCLWYYSNTNTNNNVPLFMQDAASSRSPTTYKWMAAIVGNVVSSAIGGGVRLSDNSFYYAETTGTLGKWTNKWIHYCMSFDKNLTSSRLKIFVDGVNVASHNAANLDIQAGGYPEFGRWEEGSTYFNGKLDEVSLWHRALNANEISKMYNMQKASYTGVYTSDVMDAGSAQDWDILNWDPLSPYLKELPLNGLQDGGYQNNKVSMNTATATNEFYLKLNETGTPTSFTDSSGLNNNFSCSNCPDPFVDGRFDGAMDFNGTDDVISLNDNSLNNSHFTISLWINPDRTPDNSINEQTISKAGDASNHATFQYNHDSTTAGRECAWRFESSGFVNYTAQYASCPPTNVWTNITATYDGTSLKIYQNGIYDKLIAGVPITGNQPIYIGSGFGAGPVPDAFFDGKIDEVAYWDKALSDTEIFNLFNRGANRVRFQVRSCADVSCSADPDFVGPSSSTANYFSELLNTSLGLPSLDISGTVPTNRYFQYRMYLESDNSSSSPKVNNIRVYSQ